MPHHIACPLTCFKGINPKFNGDPFFEILERKGEDQVRVDLAAKRYNERKTRLAELWLERKEHERAEAALHEQMKIAKDAAMSARITADSSRTAAREARSANTIAKSAIAIAIISLAIAIADILVF